MKRRRFIVIGLLEHLGDIVACEPVARHMRAENPRAFVVWVVSKPFAELVITNPNIDRVIIAHCLGEWAMLARLPFLDRTVNLHFEDRYCRKCGKEQVAPHPAGVPHINLTNFYHHGSILETFSMVAGLPKLSEPPQLYIQERHRKHVGALALPDRFIAVHCRSGMEPKDWPPQQWRAFAQFVLSDLKIPIVEIGGGDSVINLDGPLYVDLCGKLSILESAEVIRRATLFVGIDSGPAHLANAVNTPGILLMGNLWDFGAYMPFSGGYGDGIRGRILRSTGPVRDLPLASVLQFVRYVLASLPENRTIACCAEQAGTP